MYPLGVVCQNASTRLLDDAAAKAASAFQDMSHDGTPQAITQDFSGGDEDTANAADAAPTSAPVPVPAPAPAPAAYGDSTPAPTLANAVEGDSDPKNDPFQDMRAVILRF
jgi:hypothetical protein